MNENFEPNALANELYLTLFHFWMFSIYDKDEMGGWTADQEKQLKQAIAIELKGEVPNEQA